MRQGLAILEGHQSAAHRFAAWHKTCVQCADGLVGLLKEHSIKDHP